MNLSGTAVRKDTHRDHRLVKVDRICHAARLAATLDLLTGRQARNSDISDRAALSLNLDDPIQASISSIPLLYWAQHLS
jgi:hypothetical protein